MKTIKLAPFKLFLSSLVVVVVAGVLACGDGIIEPQLRAHSNASFSGVLAPDDSLPLIAVSPGTSLMIQYTDSLGVSRSETIPGDSLALYPRGLTIQYQLVVPTGRRGGISLNDSTLEHSGTLTLGIGHVLWAQSAETLAWGSDSSVMVPAYLAFLANPTRSGLDALLEEEDDIRDRWGDDGDGVVTMLRFFANPVLLGDTILNLSADLPYPPYAYMASASSSSAHSSSSLQTTVTSPQEGVVRFYYMNGIHNTQGDNDKGAEAFTSVIRAGIPGYTGAVTGLYNDSWFNPEPLAGCIRALASLRAVSKLSMITDEVRARKILGCVAQVYPDLVEAYFQLANVNNDYTKPAQGPAWLLATRVINTLDSGYAAIILSHSQGTLMSQEALAHIGERGGDLLTRAPAV